MTLLYLRLALLAMGIIVWGYGHRVEDQRIRWIGIALLATSLILRFFRRRPAPEHDATKHPHD